MWFKELMGFEEKNSEQVRENCRMRGAELWSKANGKCFHVGEFEILSLAELRQRAATCFDNSASDKELSVSELVGNVQLFHQRKENQGALFQVASQFNLLEMVSPSVTPEIGVDEYEYDGTQGPACAVAAGAGTIFRNYFVELEGGQIGQSSDRQIDCLAELGEALGNADDGNLWEMRNGYALPSESGLRQVDAILAAASESELAQYREKLRIGVHWNVQVTLNDCQHCVAQVFGSALPVAYSSLPRSLWQRFATLVLKASYEATLLAALLNAQATGNRKVFLTLLGGGAFGNDESWIFQAIKRALDIVADQDLDVKIVSYGSSNPEVVHFIEEHFNGALE